MGKEDKSKEYVEAKVKEYDKFNIVKNYGMQRAMTMCDFNGYDIQDAFVAGWNEALKSQWVDVNDKQPNTEEVVLCHMVSNGAIVSGYVCREAGKWRVATNPDFEFEDYGEYECDYWMPIPSFENILENNKYVFKRLKDN